MLVRRSLRAGTAGFVLATLLAVGMACEPDAESAPKLSQAAEDGREVARNNGCVACHGSDGEGGVGPRWTGLYGREVELENGSTVVADETYLKRAIDDPDADVRTGFAVSMPENDLDADDVDAVVAYIEGLGS